MNHSKNANVVQTSGTHAVNHAEGKQGHMNIRQQVLSRKKRSNGNNNANKVQFQHFRNDIFHSQSVKQQKNDWRLVARAASLSAGQSVRVVVPHHATTWRYVIVGTLS